MMATRAGDVYPRGGWRPADGVQRGSVEDITLYPGDPLTPGVGATASAQRLPIASAPTLDEDSGAADLLCAMRSRCWPPWAGRWRRRAGAARCRSPITSAQGPARVHLQVQSDWSLKPIYDVIARMPGSELPDEWIVRGNHHDGWVFGAWDPLAGNVRIARGGQGDRRSGQERMAPARTLIYASWDGEEPGLLGSTEWVETHAAELAQHAVIYVNSDTNERGFFQAERQSFAAASGQ